MPFRAASIKVILSPEFEGGHQSINCNSHSSTYLLYLEQTCQRPRFVDINIQPADLAKATRETNPICAVQVTEIPMILHGAARFTLYRTRGGFSEKE